MKNNNQLIFWTAQDQLERLSELGDRLELLDKMIDWKIFKDLLEEKLNGNKDPKKGGRPRFDVLVMLKTVILQALNGDLSNEKAEFMLTDRLSWQRFVGIPFGKKIPDENTIRDFKEAVGSETMLELFDLFNETLLKKGVITNKGTLVDATFNEVPRRRATTREENASLKKGDIPDSLKKIEKPEDRDLTREEKAHNNKIAQIDTDATWTKKGNETYFGYKGHAAVDTDTKLVTGVIVTTASVHDVKIYVQLIIMTYTFLAAGIPVDYFISYADSGYTGIDYADTLKDYFKNICDVCFHVIKRAKKGKPLKGWEKSYNRSVAKIRCRVEHVFGAITNDMGGIYTKSIGLERNTRDIVTKFFAYNIKRAAYLANKSKAAA